MQCDNCELTITRLFLLLSSSVYIYGFHVVVQRCVPPPCPLSTGHHPPQSPPEEVALKPQQPSLAGQTQTQSPLEMHPKVES